MRSAIAGFSALALVAIGIVVADPAAAATTITVGTTVDTDANGACANPGVTTPASPASLRNALCVANNVGGATTVTVPAGTYTLSNGALVIGTDPGTSVELDASGGRPIIQGDGTSQLLTIDPGILGGIDVDIDGFEFRGGRDALFGGGAIIAGSFDAADPDTLVINDTVFADNHSTGGTANPGGAIQFIGGDLTITRSTFTTNRSGSASGGALYYEATSASDSLTVSGSRFTDNSVSAGGIPAGGGGIAVGGTVSSSVQITGNAFIGNIASGPGAGAGALEAVGAPITAQYNSFRNNAVGDIAVRASGTLTNNWWGCNGGPGSTGCDGNSPSSSAAIPYLVMTVTAADDTIESTESTELTASLLTNSAGATISGADLVGLDGTMVSWSAAEPAGSSLSPDESPLINGEATTTFVAGGIGGRGGALARYDSSLVPITVDVRQIPAFTSAASATATVGLPFLFTVTTTGYPLPAVSIGSDTMPPGLLFTPVPGGAIISGLPSSPGSYSLTLTADNGGTSAQQVLTITVGSAPAFTGTLAATAAAGDPVDVEITASGSPTPAITATTTLPAGLSLTDGGDGTARLQGTPTAAPGTYEIGLSANNTIATTPGLFSLTITSAPSFTSADHTQFTAGAAGDFAVTVDPGFPALNAVTLAGAPAWLSLIGAAGAQRLVGTPPAGSGGTYALELSIDGSTVVQDFTLTVNEPPTITDQPDALTVVEGADAVFTATAAGFPVPGIQWQRFTGGSWTDLGGATATTLSFPAAIADDGARVRAVFTSVSGTTISDEAVLTVGQLPAFDVIDPVTALAGGALTIDITSTGLPVGAITASGVPSWLTFTDHGDGTATLTGTPVLTDAGTAAVALTIDNGFGTDELTVDITVEAEVPLPLLLPVADGALSGVPPTVLRGQQITVGGSGYLPGAVIQLGIYSTPALLGTAVADATGAFSTTVAIAADQSIGAHTVAASGISATGTARLLTASTTVVEPPSTGGGATGGTTTTGLPETGLEGSQAVGLALIALLAVLAGFALVRAARRRSV